MLRNLIYLIVAINLVVGCARMPTPQPTVITIDDIKVDSKSNKCIAVCSTTHNQCVKNAFGDAFALGECKNSYQSCTDSCPSK